MGRNKKSGNRGLSAQNSERDKKLQNEYNTFLENFQSLLHLEAPSSSSLTHDERSTREAFADSLENLANCLESKKRKGSINQIAFELMNIENAAARMRICAEAFSSGLSTRKAPLRKFQSLKSSVKEMNRITKEIDYIHPVDFVEITLRASSFISQYNDQIDLDKHIVSSCIESLSCLYDSSVMPLMQDELERIKNINAYLATTPLYDELKTNAIAIREKIMIDSQLYEVNLDLIEEMRDALEKSKCEDPPLPLSNENSLVGDFNTEEKIKTSTKTYSSRQKNVAMSTQFTKNRYNDMLQATSLTQAVDLFISHDDKDIFTSDISSRCLLLTGPSGYGKSFLCNHIYNKITENNRLKEFSKSQCHVIFPKLPVDLMGQIVGESEEILLSFFIKLFETRSSCPSSKCILILDGIDHILGSAFGETSSIQSATHATNDTLLISRLRASFTKLMDYMKCHHKYENKNDIDVCKDEKMKYLLICTSRTSGDGISERFDKIFKMEPPNDVQRESIIRSCLLHLPPGKELENSDELRQSQTSNENDIFSRIISCTVGRSAAEISQICREVITMSSSQENQFLKPNGHGNNHFVLKKRLSTMDKLLHNMTPESITGGALDGIVDINIYTSKDLVVKNGSALKAECPLFGDQMSEAWNQLKSIIVTPLCQAHDLDDLLYGNTNKGKRVHQGGKIICAGVLLTGPPGSGKTELAKHCSRFSTQILPSVKLLDVSCTSLVHKEVGGTERAIEKLFSAAKAAAPCILLLDGIENIASVRGNDNTSEGTMDRALSTLLIEMDGVDDATQNSSNKTGHRVAIVGITHDPNLIDPALRRPGRLEKCITLTHPDSKARSKIFMKEAEKLPLDFSAASFIEPKNIQELSDYVAYQTSGRSAAGIKSVCAEAAMFCIRDNIEGLDAMGTEILVKNSRPTICHKHILSALELSRVG